MKETMDYVIVVCPCCASPVDAPVSDEPEKLDCEVCGQKWTMTVDRDRHAEYAL